MASRHPTRESPAKRDRPPAAPSQPPRPTWGAIADAVGHCVLVFAFLPTLAVLPRWLVFEAGNPLNAQDAVVLAFVPVRAFVLLIRTFVGGVVQGVAAGVIDGVLVAGWIGWRGGAPSRAQAVGIGAIAGAVAAAVMVLAILTLFASERGIDAPTIAFEAAMGVACGAVAAPGAMRLLYRTRSSAGQ